MDKFKHHKQADRSQQPPSFEGRSSTLRACSFNIRYDNPDDEYSWDKRRDQVFQTIESIAPDLLGIQEALPHQFDDLRELSDEYEWYGVGRKDGHREGEFVPIGWRHTDFEMIETGEFWLSETPTKPSIGWDADFPRVATWVSLCHQHTKRQIWFCNTHLSHVGEEARMESVKLIREQAYNRTESGTDVIITGDFNSEPSQDPYRLLIDTTSTSANALIDSRRKAEIDSVYGTEGTYHGFTDEPKERIDYIFIGDIGAVKSYWTLPIQEGEYRSDHLPIAMEMEYEPKY
ncbi:endonuclease/exonuclease/phosphatase family protein [Haladaptatus sp. R4]|uniref:endonuclease/exonuclease/phosphatase family protein n=1 Tax=Haladaptatus sp. R4 TaxID=1679489 RepID=UPI0009EE1CD1|nr:endonuclease/exonuclease/phosphatase family protein [Haladaptatus sp. R4]